LTAKPTPDPVDLHVGAMIRTRRKQIGVTQERLAAALGLTFQQVQKYERGHNRISASMLFKTAEALRAPPSHFFEGLPARVADVPPETSPCLRLAETANGQKLAEIYLRLDPHARAGLDRIVEAMDGAIAHPRLAAVA
jgi:transcriptional regulator with XRE-family HTH domain